MPGVVFAEGESDESLLLALNDSKEYKSLVKKRAAKRQSVTKCLNKIATEPCETELEINFFVQKLTTLRDEITEIDAAVECYMLEKDLWSDGEYNRQFEVAETYVDKIQQKLLLLNSKLVIAPVVNTSQQDNIPAGLPKLKLPQIPFPTFDGKPEKFRRFIDSFDSILNKFNLTSFEKYSYLSQQLTGTAKDIITALPDENLSYEGAKALLESAFADKTLQQFSVIDNLCKLKLNNSENVYLWISEVRQLADQIQRLDIDSTVFAQYFVWNNMSDTFKKQFMAVSNCAKPSLQMIIDHSFEVVKRMDVTDNKGSYVKSQTFATKVDYTPKETTKSSSYKFNVKFHCALCNSLGKDIDFNHKIHLCKKFPTPQTKVKKISELGGCTRCGFLNHTVNQCKYKFSGKCIKCNA